MTSRRPRTCVLSAWTASVVVQVVGVMNKMTVDKFEKLSEKLIEMPINTAVLLKGVIKIVFDKVSPNRVDVFVRVLS